jgi:hypothetical protein
VSAPAGAASLCTALRIDYRWGGGDVERYRALAVELVALAPDVIWTTSNSAVSASSLSTSPSVLVHR